MGGGGSWSQTTEACVPVIDEGWKTERVFSLWSAGESALRVFGNSQLVLHQQEGVMHHLLIVPSKTEGTSAV